MLPARCFFRCLFGWHESAKLMTMKLLVVEDDPEGAAYLVKAFREAGHVADHAADG